MYSRLGCAGIPLSGAATSEFQAPVSTKLNHAKLKHDAEYMNNSDNNNDNKHAHITALGKELGTRQNKEEYVLSKDKLKVDLHHIEWDTCNCIFPPFKKEYFYCITSVLLFPLMF